MPVLLSLNYRKLQFKCKYRCKNSKKQRFIFFTKKQNFLQRYELFARWRQQPIYVIEIHNFIFNHISCRSNIFVIKWGKKCWTSIMVEFLGHKNKNPYLRNKKTESILVISMPENTLVPILRQCQFFFTTSKPNLT